MNSQLVFSKNGTLYLDTALSQSSFAKARLSERLGEQGFLARRTSSGWTFAPWTFTGTVLQGGDAGQSVTARQPAETVLLEGRAFDGCTLKNYLDLDFSRRLNDGEKATVIHACAVACAAMEEAVRQQVPLGGTGGGGIFIALDFSQVLFLPSALFKSSASCCGDAAFSEYLGMYVQQNLSGAEALRFSQAVVAYRALTGRFPFESASTERRQEDCLDHNYVPLRNSVWALDEKLSAAVDGALCRAPRLEERAKQGRSGSRLVKRLVAARAPAAPSAFPLAALYRELGLAESGAVPPGGRLSSVIRKASVSQEQFESNVKREAASFARTLRRRRWLRRHGTAVTAAVIVAAAVIVGTAGYLSGRSRAPTTVGLTARQAASMFYSALNTMDVTSAQGCVYGGQAGAIVDAMSQVYVSTRARFAYDSREQTVSPAEWICRNFDGYYSIFGFTRFYIDGAKADLFFEGPAKDTRPHALEEEGGQQLRDGQTKTVQAAYNFVTNVSDKSVLTVVGHVDTVELLYRKNRWVVTGVDQRETGTISVDFAAFYEDYKDTFAGRDKDILETTNLLQKKYGWMCDNSEVLDAAARLERDASF